MDRHEIYWSKASAGATAGGISATSVPAMEEEKPEKEQDEDRL